MDFSVLDNMIPGVVYDKCKRCYCMVDRDIEESFGDYDVLCPDCHKDLVLDDWTEKAFK